MKEHICQTLMEYAVSKGAGQISKLPGLWESQVDDKWTIKCNGHPEDMDGVPAFSWYIEFNGWPAGVLGIAGDGVLCAGEAGNEDSLRKALLIHLTHQTTKP